MISVFTATATELAKLKPIGRGLFILGRDVVAALTVNTLKHNIIAWHLFSSDFRLLLIPIAQFPFCRLLLAVSVVRGKWSVVSGQL